MAVTEQKIEISECQSKEECLANYYLLVQLYPDAFSEEEYSRRLDAMLPRGYRQVVVKLNDEVVGVAGFTILTRLYYGKTLELEDLVVNQHHRALKLGQKLLHWVEAEGKKCKCQIIYLHCATHRHPSHKFYHRENFTNYAFHFKKELAA